MLFRLFVLFLLGVAMAPEIANAGQRRPAAHHQQVERRCSPAQVRSQHCLPAGARVQPPAGARAVLSTARRGVSPSHMVAQRAIMAPAPKVRDISGYRTTTFVAPVGTPYPLTLPQPGDYLCTTLDVPLGTKVLGMHGVKGYAPCGYKWAFDAGKGKGYWWLVPDPAYGVRAR